MALALGRPWLPPQRAIAEVAGELLPDGSYAHPIVAVTMPRQCAKTTTAYDVALGRGRALRDFRCKYSTHKGTITSDRFVDWFLELERYPALHEQAKLRRSRGTESIGWRRTGSYFQAFPAVDGALRSAALNLAVVDEAQEHDAVTGKALKEMIDSTFNTRARHQLWIVFSAGTDASAYAAEYLERGRGGDPLVALFDYGCPDGVDPTDEELWHTWHPGLAYGLTNRATLREALASSEAAFVREYGNIWTRTLAGPVIPAEAWQNVQRPSDMPEGRMCLGVDVAADRRSAALAVAGPDRHIELVDVVPVEHVTARTLELAERHRMCIAIDTVGPVATVLDEIRRLSPYLGDRLLTMTATDAAVAAAVFLDDVLAGRLSVWPHPALDDAVAAAVKRPLGEGFAWSRHKSAASIAPLVAACSARWGYDHLPPDVRPAVFAS